MSAYAGRHAAWYDVFYADKPYEDEARFVNRCLRAYGKGETTRLLEVACGTGTHALALEKLGYRIVAVDSSPEMVARAREKAATAGSSVQFQQQDMRALDLDREGFDAAICLFDSIGYVVTNEALARVLGNVHAHLRDGGLFVFEFWHAGAMLRSFDPVRVRRWSVADGELLRISETAIDYLNQAATVTYTIYHHANDGTYTRLREAQTNRYFSVAEMGYFLTACGFAPLKWFSGFTPDENIRDETWHVVAVAQKQG